MSFGLFGKLPQKRDFVSQGLPSQILHPWENWLQAGVSASRLAMGDQWQNYYLVAPIWRFWLGEGVLGRTCMGGVMASVDQVGRYFPLTILYVADEGEDIDPPTLANHDEWLAGLDTRLLTVLGEDAAPDPVSLLADLPAPVLAERDADELRPGKAGTLLLSGAEGEVESLIVRDYREAVRSRSYWWTAPGAMPELTGWTGLPDPQYFTRMLRFPSA